MAITINGTTGITSVNGTASTPSVTGTDTDTGIVYGTNTMSFATGGVTAVTVDSSQNVTVAGNLTLNNGAADGAQLILPSSGYSNWNIDNYSGSLRAYYNATEYFKVSATGDLQCNSGYGSVATAYGCRAWVNFNGTGTVAIRASGNVSSITDNGTGDYTVNFTNAMPDANYAAVGSTQGSGVFVLPVISVNQGNDQTTTKVDIYTTGGTTATPSDFNYITVSVFR